VYREFYYNDAGVQIDTLANSTQLRAKGFKPGDAEWPEAGLQRRLHPDIAKDFLAKKTVKADDRAFTASGDVDDLDSIRQFAVAYLRHEQDKTCRRSRSSSTTTTSNPACTPAAASRPR
jgi:arginyl-tRNA synthetase